MTFSFTSKKPHHTGTTVPQKNGASAMRETVIGDGGAIKGLKTWIAVSVTLVALLGVLGSSASAAHAESPWWHLTSGSRPAYLSHDAGLPGEATAPGVDEVQQLKIEEEAAFIVGPQFTAHEIEEEEYRSHPEAFAEVTKTMSAAEIQQALEKPEIYGSGNVHVTGGPETYTITFVGALAGRPVTLIQQGFPGQSAITEVTAGQLPKGGTPAADEAQELNIEEETAIIVGARFTAHEIEEEEYRPFPEAFAEFSKTMTAAEIQHGLEKSEIYGAGNVHVTGGPGKYTVTFIGALADQPVALMRQAFPGQSSITEITKGTAGKPPAEPLDGELNMTAENVGDANVIGSGTPVTLTDVIPSGLHAVGVAATKPQVGGDFQERVQIPCELKESGGVQTATCTFAGELAPYDQLEMRVNVKLAGAHSGEPNEFSVSGGNAAAVAIKPPITVSSAPVPFGIESYGFGLEEEGGTPTVQAGAHPFQLTTTIALNQLRDINPLDAGPEFRSEVTPPALTKDLNFKLPAGLLGNATFVPQCTTAQFFQTRVGTGEGETENGNACPADTAVGVAVVTVHEPVTVGTATFTEPIFNLEPRVGEPARFGFYVVIANSPVFLDTSVRTGEDYGVTVHVNNITQTAAFLSSEVTFWGAPGDTRHNGQRGWGCLGEARHASPHLPCNPSEETHPKPLLTLPTSCTDLDTSVEGDSWAEPSNVLDVKGEFSPENALTGCNRLQFAPEIKVAPDAQETSKPTGLTVDVHVPQEVNSNAAGYASSNVKGITVKLPAGVAVNPSSADGLEACSEGLVGFTGFGEFMTDPGVSNPLFSPTLPGGFGSSEAREPGRNFCPDAAKIAEVTIHSPLLPANQLVKGFAFLAAQEANPFNSVLAMYIVAEDPISGTVVKLPGEVQICQAAGEVLAGMSCEVTGQLVSTFENNPQLSFEDAEFHFFGGERAPLATPTRCGLYKTEAAFTPWSGTPAVRSSSSFELNSGPNHSACVYPGQALPFNPTLTGGATNIQAGAFSPFTLTMSRLPGEQNLQSVEAHLPPGLSGILSNVELCPEPQANAGACGPNSLIGETTVSVGVGGDPFTVHGGKFFLTGPYNGSGGCAVGTAGCAPFGITFEVPAKAGPFDFAKTARNHPACDCVLVRGKIEINPTTAAITIVTNQPGTADSIPTELEGIPLEIQHVNAITTRGNFQFNPTNCNKLAVSGTIHSSEGGTDTISVPLQVTNCAALKFAPKFSVSTKGKNSKPGGATLTAKLSYPSAPQGTYANITRVKVDLPKQLPSRLTTLQKACTSKQFELNPANCPKESKIGYAKVTTPLLPVPLEGPAIFVSHGNESFPSLTMVLQGYGVTVDLVGTTFISKAGITSTTFKTVPDVPFNTFTLTLGQGKFSALAASVPTKQHYSLCGQTLNMPTEFLAQNGAKINQTTKIGVSGCKKAKKKTKKKAKHKTKKAGGGKGGK
jgi:hypothetical protein